MLASQCETFRDGNCSFVDFTQDHRDYNTEGKLIAQCFIIIDQNIRKFRSSQPQLMISIPTSVAPILRHLNHLFPHRRSDHYQIQFVAYIVQMEFANNLFIIHHH